MENILFKNFRTIMPFGVEKKDIYVENGLIKKQEKSTSPYKVIEGNGDYLSPGFIDIHVHGGGGYDFMDCNPYEYNEIAKFHTMHGTTAMYPTIMAEGMQSIYNAVKAFENTDSIGARLIGLHLEGPYISLEQKGALNEKFIHQPIEDEYKQIFALSPFIKRMTMAPELAGCIKLSKYLNSIGRLASIGHTNALCEEILNAYEQGHFTIFTHFYSAMSSVRRINAYRYAGAVEAAYLLNKAYIEVIADGRHLPKELLRLIVKQKLPDKIILVTDAMRGAGMAEGESVLGARKDGIKVIIEDGVAKLLDRSAFAGSVATCDMLLRTMLRCTDITIADAVNMVTINPARAMGIDKETGSLEEGKRADIVIFDDNINIRSVYINGKEFLL